MAKQKILIIDDDAAIRKWVATTLIEEGFDCHEAENGEVGVAVAPVFLPNVILCDIEMPRLNGYEVYQKLSQNPKTASTPFIFMTGSDSHEQVRKGMSLGADDYLTKPMTSSELSYDSLTGLPNRQLLLKQFRSISRENLQMTSLAILSVGVDNLTQITEAFGIRCAESVLRMTTRRLKHCLCEGALLYRGKFDSFDILIWDIKEQEKVEEQLRQIIRGVNEVVSFKKHSFRIKVSIGWNFYDSQSDDPLETFLNHAETARHYAGKEAEKGYHRYLPAVQKSVVGRLVLENHLYKALSNKEFFLLYQPQVDIRSRQVNAVETLIRWKNSHLGMVSPLDFIPLAEESGLIVPIGKWVLEQSCLQLKKWQRQGLDMRMAVNVSGSQLVSGEWEDEVKNAICESGIEPADLEIEITESLLIRDVDKTLVQMKALKKQGVKIAIDDFGTGYSSLAILKKLPFDALKIDRSFVNDIEAHASNTEIVAAIIKMAKTLKLKTIAEGVETSEQLKCLKAIGCDEYQGFLFSRPVPECEIPNLMKSA